MNNFKKDYYGILQVSPTASFDEIKLTYRRLVKKYHPDLHPDNPDYEALIKEINEAYGVLNNKNERFAYDQYRLDKQRSAQASATATEKNKRTYTKTTTVYREERTYVKGKIFIKYFGEHAEQEAENILRETFYKITITKIEATIESIFKQNLTPEFQEVFSKNKPIQLKIKQPINCIVKHKNGDDINYKLEILDLTIPNPEIINVTKHEDQSFGTITGVFYGYIKEIKSHEESVIVEECYGETGKTEEKTENGIKYYRKEYYNTDCTKYWGNWIGENIRYASPRSTSRNQYRARHWRTRSNYASSNASCLGSFGGTLGFILSLLFFLFLMPKLAFLFSFVIIPLLFKIIPSNTWRWVARAIFILFGLIFTLAIIASIRSNYQKKNERTVVNPKPNPIKPKYTPVTDSSSNKLIKDTLISHELSWEDYDGKTYEGRFSIKKSISDQAHFYKENLNISADSEASYDKIVYLLKENDKNNLSGLYSMFDSLRLANRPSQMKFAEIIVASIQSIPYTLILPKACNPQLYQDEFIIKYLASPMARCDGYEKYGINTPVEFITYLDGDCDTRTLLLYTVLSHYNYDVALLSSAHYSHSVLGINLPYDGLAFDYNNQRYVLWETTVQNIKPGILSNEVSNTDYWRISLKSK